MFLAEGRLVMVQRRNVVQIVALDPGYIPQHIPELVKTDTNGFLQRTSMVPYMHSNLRVRSVFFQIGMRRSSDNDFNQDILPTVTDQFLP